MRTIVIGMATLLMMVGLSFAEETPENPEPEDTEIAVEEKIEEEAPKVLTYQDMVKEREDLIKERELLNKQFNAIAAKLNMVNGAMNLNAVNMRRLEPEKKDAEEKAKPPDQKD